MLRFLLNMLPRLAADDGVNCRTPHVKHGRDGKPGDSFIMEPSYLTDLPLREFGECYTFAPCGSLRMQSLPASFSGRPRLRMRMHPAPSTRRHTPLRERVLDVVFLGAQEQVVRVSAVTDVAMVADLKAVRRTNVPLIRNDMRSALLSTKSEGTVTVAEKGSRPNPARAEPCNSLGFFLDDLRPEAGAVGLRGGYNAHVSTSVSTTGVGLPPATTNRAGASSCLNFTTREVGHYADDVA